MSSEITDTEALKAVQFEIESIDSVDLYNGDDEGSLQLQLRTIRKIQKFLELLQHISNCGKQLCKQCKEITRMLSQHSAKHLCSPRYQCDLPFCGELLALMKDKLVLTPGPCLFTVQHIRENMTRIIHSIV